MKWSKLFQLVAVLSISILIFSSAAAKITVPDIEETKKTINKIGGKDKYPEANAVIVKSINDVEYNEDGTAMFYSYGLVKILTEKAIDSWSEIHTGYARSYDTVFVEAARVLKADGSIVNVPEDMITDISVAMMENMNIYDPESKDKVITFKNLEVGDAVEYLIVDSLFTPPIEGEFDGFDFFQTTDPIVSKIATVTGPKSNPLRYKTYNGDITFSKKEKDDKIIYTWSAENTERIITEPAMPPVREIAPSVLYTTIDSWEDISRWWNKMAESKYDMNDALRNEVTTLTADATTKEEKVDAIYRFVAQKVRYMGLGTGKKKGFEPKPATETYATKYGVCRDVAALMVTMLREADVDADIVLTGMGYHLPKDIPTIGFNHAIVAIKNDDGTYYYADPTVENSVDILPAVEAEQQILVCTDEGKVLEDTPYSPPDENMGNIKAISNLNEEGLFTSDVTISTDGFYDMAFRNFARQMPPEQIRMIWNYIISDVYPGIVLTDFSIGDPEDLATPLEIKFSYQIADYPMPAGEFTLMKSPVSLGAFELISKSVFTTASLPERKYPWRLGFTFGATEEEIITIPEGYKIKSIPNSIVKEDGPIEYKMSFTSVEPSELDEGGTKITFKKSLKLKAREVSPEDYKLLKETLKISARSSRGEIIMTQDK